MVGGLDEELSTSAQAWVATQARGSVFDDGAHSVGHHLSRGHSLIHGDEFISAVNFPPHRQTSTSCCCHVLKILQITFI